MTMNWLLRKDCVGGDEMAEKTGGVVGIGFGSALQGLQHPYTPADPSLQPPRGEAGQQGSFPKFSDWPALPATAVNVVVASAHLPEAEASFRKLQPLRATLDYAV